MKGREKSWIDISQTLHTGLAHWPGDRPFSYQVTYSKEETGSVNIGQMAMSLHSGTHVDAPFHYKNDGNKILDLDINVFIGKAKVIDVSAYKAFDEAVFKAFDLVGVTRLLLKTSIPNNPDVFPKNIPYITVSGAAYLSNIGIRLIGVDVPSVDPLDSKELEGHHSLDKFGIHIVENLMLDQVEQGEYEFIGLPLPLKDADGSPIRAVIRPL
ncbi:arylformamidase [Alkalihalobacillus pseudalcaliphilus]|uniref:arylformamidase n=1 Tax=Alkalihalobacillus pseudalcaliphilus TaxID=79884 RepID=UPI000B01C808|nr:arylformamidase [Alkalihalobacillus pseudalcaliphilus]